MKRTNRNNWALLLVCFAAVGVLTALAQAKSVIKMENGQLTVGREVKRTPQTNATSQAGSTRAVILSRDAWIDGQVEAPVALDQGTLSFWLYPLDWAQGAGWRVIFNWRSALSPPPADFDSLWVRSDPQGALSLMMGDFQNKKWDILSFALPHGTAPQWTHVTFTWDPDGIQAYADGVRVAQKTRVHKLPTKLGTHFRLGGPHSSGDQGSEAVALLEVDDELWAAEKIQQRISEQKKLLSTPTPAPAAPAPTAAGQIAPSDLTAPQYGATAYASSFSLELDPRKVLQRQPDALWKPDLTDTNPRFYMTWPGEVVFDQVSLEGNAPPETVRLFAGAGRLEMKEHKLRATRDAQNHTILTLEQPVSARVVELHFVPDAGVALRQIGVRLADGSRIAADKTIVLQKDKPVEAALTAGQHVRFELDSSLLSAQSEKPWIVEVEQTASEPFRNYQDYRAGRALVFPATPATANVAISEFATSGNYGIYLSRLEDVTRTQLGTVKISGRDMPTWPADHQPGFPQVQLDLQNHLLPNIVINDQSTPVVIMVLGATSFEKIAGYKKTGARLWRFNSAAAGLLETPDISKNVEAAIAETEQNVKNILALAPNAQFMIGLDTRPRAQWIAQYPDTLYRTASGKKGYGVNSGSSQLRQDLAQSARLFTEALAKKPYADRVVAILPYFGRSGDGWGYGMDESGFVGRDRIALGDRAPAEEAGFTRWLEAKYGGPLTQTLKGYWNDAAIAQPARVPPDARLAASDTGLFLDPAAKQDVIDYWKYRGESVVGAILDFGEAVQKASAGRLLYGAHYGYTTGILRNQAPGVAQIGGHFNLGDMLQSPSVKVVNAVSSGDKRGSKDNYELVSPMGSALLHEKLPILELDNRTPLTRGVPPFEYYQLFSFDDFLNGARKDIGFALTHGMGVHWYDMSMPHIKNVYFREPWYLEDDFYDVVQQAVKLGVLPTSQSPLAADVAVFVDERVVPYQDPYDSFVYENLTRYLTESLSQAGVGYRTFLLSDYEQWSKTKEASDTKLEIFLNGWLEPKSSWTTVAASPRAQLWFYGANLLSSGKFNDQPATQNLLGFDLERKGELTLQASQLTLDPAFRQSSAALPESYANHPYSDFHKSQRQLFGESLASYYVPAKTAGITTLARFADGTPGLIQSQAGGHPRFFSSLPYLPVSVLRGLYERVGIRPQVPFGDWWVAEGRGLLSINTQEKVDDPQLLQSWLKQRPLVLGSSAKSVGPGQSYVVQSPAETPSRKDF